MIYSKKEILDFINRRFSKDCDWINGNCLWFAFILKVRFALKIVYFPIIGHFAATDGEYFYDANGIYEPEEEGILFADLAAQDDLWAKRLIRDCWE